MYLDFILCVKQYFSRSNWKKFHLAKYAYTTSGYDGCDKYQVCIMMMVICMLMTTTSHIALRRQERPSFWVTAPKSCGRYEKYHHCQRSIGLLTKLILVRNIFHPFQLCVDAASLFYMLLLNKRSTGEVREADVLLDMSREY